MIDIYRCPETERNILEHILQSWNSLLFTQSLGMDLRQIFISIWGCKYRWRISSYPDFLYKLQCIQLLFKMRLHFHLLQASQGLLGTFLCLNITTCLSSYLYWSLRLARLSCFFTVSGKNAKIYKHLQNASRIIPHPPGNVKALL